MPMHFFRFDWQEPKKSIPLHHKKVVRQAGNYQWARTTVEVFSSPVLSHICSPLVHVSLTKYFHIIHRHNKFYFRVMPDSRLLM